MTDQNREDILALLRVAAKLAHVAWCVARDKPHGENLSELNQEYHRVRSLIEESLKPSAFDSCQERLKI